MVENYSAKSIKTLDYFEHIRQYPGMYIGSKDLKGLHHCIKEIISNAIDEYLNGAGDTIIVKLLKNNGVYIKDNGRGIPHGTHESGCSTLQACFGIANTGGKFDNATGQTGYNTSGGEHGTGGKAVNALSTKMIVTTAREGVKEIVEFSKGQFVSYNKIKSDEQGVEVTFYPDAEIFETVKVDAGKLKELIREFSYLDKGLTFEFEDENTNEKETFLSQNGLYDYINYLGAKKEFIIDPLYFNERDGQFQVEVAIGYTSDYSNIVKLYTNNIPQEKGTHLTGFKTAWTSVLNKFGRDKKWLKEKDSNLTGSDFEEGQILIINFKMIDPVFKGQNKEELSSSEGRTYVQRLTTQALDTLLPTNEKAIKVLFDKALAARKARDAAKRARDAARNKAPKKKALLNLPSKLVDAWSKDREKCELLIAEGDSAASGLIGARDGEYQSVFPIRGKVINTYKNKPEKVFANQEVVNIIKALGLDMDTKTNKLIYDKNKLRYGKIFMCCDADPDGQAIKNLLLTYFWSICPELIINGHLYTTLPPLFRITTSKNEYIYLTDAEALEEYKEKNKGKKFLVNRNKGLGEQDADELEECLLNPKTRNVAQITVSDIKKTEVLFDTLMGPVVAPRRAYLLAHAEEANI